MFRLGLSRKKMIVVLSAVGIYLFVTTGYMVYAMPKMQRESPNVAIQQKAAGTEKALEATHKAVDDLNKDVQAKAKQVEEASKSVGQLQVQNQTLQSQVDTLKQQNDTLLKEKDALAQERNYLAQQTQDLTQKIQLQSYNRANSKTSSAVQTLSYSGSRKPIDTVKVLATAYGPDCEGCTGITYTGVDVRNSTPNIIAVDPSVIPLKSVVELVIDGKSLGVYTAEDIGSAIKGNRIDILYSSEAATASFGAKKCEVRILSKPSKT